MGSLFSKIFLWFWVAMIVVTAASLSVGWMTRPDPDRFFRDVRGLHIIGLADMSEQMSPNELQAALETHPFLRHERGMVLADPSDVDILGRSPGRDVLEAVHRVRSTGRAESTEDENGSFDVRAVLSASGRRYTIVCRGGPGGPGGGPPHGILPALWPLIGFLTRGATTEVILRLLALVAATFLVTYGLARYLTSPIVRLREAATDMAGGNFDVRLTPGFQGRRDELVDLARDFDRMAEYVQDLLKSQRRLLGDISHELRTPLTRLGVALELARDSSPPDAVPHLDRIAQESQRLQELIGRIITLVRLQSPGDQFTQGSLSLAELATAVAGEAELEARSRKVTIDISTEGDTTVMASRELLRRAFENVLRNAVRYTAEGTAVDLQVRRDGSRVVVTVRDHGPGVAPDHLDKLFEPFFRCEAGRERQSGGVGLGLAIVERAVAFHDGGVHAENAPDGGLVVEMEFPLLSAAPTA